VKKYTKLIEYFNAIDHFDDMKRYAKQDKTLWQRDPAHCYNMGIIADYLIETLHLDNLDYKKVRQLIDHHDLCELGWTQDYETTETWLVETRAKNKEEKERANIDKISKQFDNQRLKTLWNEYENQSTSEARFVKAVDKIETVNHKLVRGLNKGEATPEFTATFPNNFISKVPELIPFWQEFQQHIAKEFGRQGIEWKEEYNIKL